MKRVLLVLIPLLLVSCQLFAQSKGETVTLNGTIIDTRSVKLQQDDLEDFVAGYTKEKALQPIAIDSGYSIYLAENFNGYMNFDNGSTAKIADYLRQPESTLTVTVQALVGDYNSLSLISIQKQQE